jgi:hypothetical protein
VVRTAAQALAANRTLFGIAYLAAPRRTAMGWVGRAGAKPGSTVLTRALGVRDLTLAVGGLAALRARDPRATRAWFGAQAVADAVDLAATVAVRDSLPRSGFLFGSAMAGASTAIAVAAALGADQANSTRGEVNAMESQPDREPEGQPNEQQGPSNPDESVPSESDVDQNLPGVPEEAEQG